MADADSKAQNGGSEEGDGASATAGEGASSSEAGAAGDSGGATAQCQLTTADIITRIAERESARREKDWGRADSIREELRGAGVEVYDRDKEWKTADGRRGIIGSSQICNLTDAQIQASSPFRQRPRNPGKARVR